MASEKLIEIKFDERKLRRLEHTLRGIPRAMPRVMARSINKTAVSARASAARKISAVFRMKISDIKKGIRLRKASSSRWMAELYFYGRRQPLLAFGARQTKKGVSYQIGRTTGRKRADSAFIQTMPSSGHMGVFKRKGMERLPIQELFGVSVGHVFRTSGRMLEEAKAEASEKLHHNIDVQVSLLLNKGKAA